MAPIYNKLWGETSSHFGSKSCSRMETCLHIMAPQRALALDVVVAIWLKIKLLIERRVIIFCFEIVSNLGIPPQAKKIWQA